ncbi:DNA-3-methyladenine glycosylase family protein [Ruania zhangjianzhongii]|uniref:DNA-3-methyladenine glycosylase family protein n=1 Tax=Ruania zhangjianzhongii TaxID=2603206 RepID=UPI00143DC8B0|nr:DNA-3-methyladenine glycosylase 2 family protein [Ruania zhangjianzhongii]
MQPVDLDVAYTPPLDVDALWDYWAARVISAVEHCDDQVYQRAVPLPGGPAVLRIERTGSELRAGALLTDLADAEAARDIMLRTIDAGADPSAVREQLGAHPWLGELVRARPGLRAPRHPGGFEVALRAIVAQQVSLRAARTVTGRLVQAVGSELPVPVGPITHLFPTPAQVLSVADDGAALAMPTARRRAVLALADAAAGGLDLDRGAPAEVGRALLALPGIGPWTEQYVRMRALDDPDAFCGSDLVLRRTAERLSGAALDPTGAEFAPWRTYAAHHLWRAAQLART